MREVADGLVTGMLILIAYKKIRKDAISLQIKAEGYYC